MRNFIRGTSCDRSPRCQTFGLFCLGITIVIGGQFFSWHKGLEEGLASMIISTTLIGTAYLSMVLCIAEMSSTLPFSGGTYGFVRVALGSLCGALVGYSEIILNVCYVSSTVLSLSKMVTSVTHFSRLFEPCYWLIFFSSTLLIFSTRGCYIYVSIFVAIYSIGFLLIYVFATSPSMSLYQEDLEELSPHSIWKSLPLCTWWYIGIEMLPLAANDCSDPKRHVPIAITRTMLTLFISSLAILLAVAAHGIPSVIDESLPMVPSFASALDISRSAVTWLSLPPIYGTAFGFVFNFSRQMTSMQYSRLLPSILPRNAPVSSEEEVIVEEDTRNTRITVLMGSILCLCLMSAVFWSQLISEEDIFLVCVLGGLIVYLNILLTYLVFYDKYSSLERSFQNPLGRAGAIYAILVFVGAGLSILALSSYLIIIVTVLFLFIAWCYYYLRARHTQCFSDEEQKVLFSAYIINGEWRYFNVLVHVILSYDLNE